MPMGSPLGRGSRLALCRSIVAVTLSAAVIQCDVDLGSRPAAPDQTLGEQVFRESCQRVAYTAQLSDQAAGKRSFVDASGVSYRPLCSDGQAPPADAPSILAAVSAERSHIILGVDTAVPRALYDDLDQALRGTMPALEGQSAQQAAEAGGTTLLQVAASRDAVAALARLGWRDGFTPPHTAGGLARGLLTAPMLHESLLAVLPVLSDSQPGAGDASGAAALKALLTATSRELGAVTAVARPQAPDRTLNLLNRFLLSESSELLTLPAGQSYPAVRRDHRGLPLVSLQAGALPSPYIDKDKDGYADSDASGRFVDASGLPIPFVTPFASLSLHHQDRAVARDSAGRALVAAAGPPLYSYQNLDATVLTALLREAPALLDSQRDLPLRLVQGASSLLGPRALAHKDLGGTRLDYQGFDKTQSPLLDMVYAYLQLLTYQDSGSGSGADLQRLLRALQLVLRTQESVLARNLDAVAKALDESKQPAYAAAQLAEQSTFYDDLLPILVRLLRHPDLVRDLLLALSDPATADLGQILGILATDSSQLFMNQNQLDTRGQPADLTSVIGTFGKPVDRSLPDSDVDKNPGNPKNNRSIMQRVLQIVHDANHATLCNKDGAFVNLKIVIDIKVAGPAKPCALFKLDELALYYLLSMADDSVKARDPYTNFLNSITDPGLKTQAQIIDGLGLLDNLLGIPGFGKYPTPAMLARMLFQDDSKRSEFFKTTLDFGPCSPARPGTLCSNQNHSWVSHYDGGLFGLEAVHPRDAAGKLKQSVNFYTAFRPIVNAFAKHDECIQRSPSGTCEKSRNAGQILVDLLAVLHRHWPTAQSRFFSAPGYEPQQQYSGGSRYEPLIAKLMGAGDLWPSTRALLVMLAQVTTDDGSNLPLSTVVARLGRWLLDPEALRLGGPLHFRDGRTVALRNDGKPTFSPRADPVIVDVLPGSAAGKVTPFDLLADAYHKKRARLGEDPVAAAEWQAAMSGLGDLYLTARPQGGGAYKLATPRLRPIALAALDLLRDRVSAHGSAMDLPSWVRGSLYPDIEQALTGPLWAASADLVTQVATSQPAKTQLYRLLAAVLADPGPTSRDAARFQALLYAAADGIQLLADDGDLVPMVRPLAPLLAPAVAGGVLGILRRSLPSDDKQVLQKLGQNLFAPDPSGRYPAFYLGEALSEINRSGAGQPGVWGTAFTADDYQALLATVGSFLRDERRGVRRLLDIINTRHGD
jgi:hypothetical protein